MPLPKDLLPIFIVIVAFFTYLILKLHYDNKKKLKRFVEMVKEDMDMHTYVVKSNF